MPICLRLFRQLRLAADSRTFCTAGKSRPISTAMMAMTTNNSINVKPAVRLVRRPMVRSSEKTSDRDDAGTEERNIGPSRDEKRLEFVRPLLDGDGGREFRIIWIVISTLESVGGRS